MTISAGLLGQEPSVKWQGQIGRSFDEDGPEQCIADLKKLRHSSSGVDHFHRFSEEWGGSELDSRELGRDLKPAHHLKLYPTPKASND